MFSHVADRKILSEGKSTLRKTTPSGVVFCIWRFLMDVLFLLTRVFLPFSWFSQAIRYEGFKGESADSKSEDILEEEED